MVVSEWIFSYFVLGFGSVGLAYRSHDRQHFIAIKMKALLFIFTIFGFHAFGAVPWTHRVVEGEDGGINGNYFFYETFKPDYGDGTLMGVQRVRAVYAQNRDGDIMVIDYFLRNGIRVVTMMAEKESLTDLIAGKEVEFKKVGEFSIKADVSVGYLTPKNPKALSDEERDRIFNLIYILSMQRSPIKGEQGSTHQPTTIE